MKKVVISPGRFAVTEEMFETAAAGVALHAPAVAPLTWGLFSSRKWLLIPNDAGKLSKVELTLVNTRDLTARVNVWYCEDTRGDGRPMPHNHPWTTFTSAILTQGYREDRYWRDDFGNVESDPGVEHRSGSNNIVDHDLFHEVVEVEPGTMTLMVCERGRRGDWTHLNVDTGEDIDGQPVDGFDEMFAALNGHLC